MDLEKKNFRKKIEEIIYVHDMIMEDPSLNIEAKTTNLEDTINGLCGILSSQLKEVVGAIEGQRLLDFKVNGQKGQMEEEILYQVNKKVDEILAEVEKLV